MRLREFNTVASVNTAVGANQAAEHSKWAKYGPGVLTAAEQLIKGKPTTALVTALRTAAPTMNISPSVQQGLDTVEGLELLNTIVRNPSALATFLLTFSKGAGEGEDEEIQRQHARMAQMSPTATQK